jgi:hypothetical protein
MSSSTVNWVTLAYTVPVVVGVIGVAVYLILNAIRGARFHGQTAQQPVIISALVVVRQFKRGKWGRPYGASRGSRGIKLIVRSQSIEITYVGRPMGGISGMQWFFDPARTTMSHSRSEGASPSAILLTEVDPEGDPQEMLALEIDGPNEQIWDTLSSIGVRAT